MKQYTKFALVIALFLGFTRCSTQTNSDNERATATSTEEVTIAMVTFPGYAPLYVAKEKGLFGEIEVDLRRIEDIGQIRVAMQSGQIDVYAATYDIFQATKGVKPPGVGFLAIDESHGGDGIAVANNVSEISNFKGKKVAAEPGFPPYFVLQYLLDEAGMTLQDVDFQDMASQDAGNAFVAKQFDIVGTYEPYLTISSEKREGAKILYSSEDIPGLIVDWLFADPDLVENSPEVLKAISEGWFEALEYIEENPDESYQIMGDAFGVSKEEMIDFKTGITWLDKNDNLSMFDTESENNAYKTFERVGDILEKNNETDLRVDAQNHLTDRIIKSLN